MEKREAIARLIKMMDKYKFSAKEKEAIVTSIGVLDWVAHGQKRGIDILKKKKERETKID